MFKGKAVSRGGDGGEAREIPPAGNIPAVLIGMIDLGTRTETFNNESKDAHHVLLVWELTGEPLSGAPTRNHVIGQRYTLSTHIKSNLRQQYEKWVGRKFEEGEEIDYSAKMAHPCLVSITHGTSGEGRTYAKVTGFGAVPKEMMPVIKPPKIQAFMWSLAEGLYLRNSQTKQFDQAGGDLPEWEWLPFVFGESVHDCIKDSHEWKALMNGTAATAKQATKAPAPAVEGMAESQVAAPWL